MTGRKLKEYTSGTIVLLHSCNKSSETLKFKNLMALKYMYYTSMHAKEGIINMIGNWLLVERPCHNPIIDSTIHAV